MRLNEIDQIQPFDINDQGDLPSMYLRYERNPAYFNRDKNIEKTIEHMPVDAYIKTAGDMLTSKWGSETKSRLETSGDKVKQYAELMKQGEKFPLPFLDFIDNLQDGLHRVEAAKLLGINKVPVIIIRNHH